MADLCPLCRDDGAPFFAEDHARLYLCCRRCDLVFVPARYHLSPEREKAVYDLHRNDPGDAGYRRFLSRLAEPLGGRLPPRSRGLDFGCGPGPTLSVMLEEMGHEVALFDVYYANRPEVLGRCYDFICASEVVEHLSRPGLVLDRLWRALKPGGWLGLMTKRVVDVASFGRWHYKNDPTHVAFFSVDTFRWLGRHWGAEPQIIGDDVVLYCKPAGAP